MEEFYRNEWYKLFTAVRVFLYAYNNWLNTMSIEDNRKLNTSVNRMQSIIDDLHKPMN